MRPLRSTENNGSKINKQKVTSIVYPQLLLHTSLLQHYIVIGESKAILDHASTSFQLIMITEAIHVQREQPSLNQQSHHVNLKLSL